MLDVNEAQTTLFRHALLPLLEELRGTDKVLYELYKFELAKLYLLGAESSPKSKLVAFATWSLYIDPLYEIPQGFRLGDINYISCLNALYVFHTLPMELRNVPISIALQNTIGKCLPHTITAEDLVRRYSDFSEDGPLFKAGREELSYELRKQIVFFFMTTNFVWEYGRDNPFAQPKLMIRLQLNKYPEIFNSTLLHGLKTYFKSTITTKGKYLIFEKNYAFYIMRFLVQNKSIIKQINSVILKDRDNFPNLVEFDAALGLYDVIDG